jgi:hypothetical protein
MSRACVCGGSNENCRFCGGLGTVPDTLATALDGRVQRLAAEQASAETTKVWHGLVSHRGHPRPKVASAPESFILVSCPEGCGARLKPGRLMNRHLTRVHGRRPPLIAKLNLPKPKKPNRKYLSCPTCNATVRVDRMEGHVSKVHKVPAERSAGWTLGNVAPPVQQQSANAAPSLTSPQTAKREYDVCSVCKVKVRISRIKKHMAKVHKSRPVRPRKGVIQSAKDVQRESTTLVAPRDKNLDATKLYAHSYRERGRFGSHPSHDGFDDESGPDEKR